MISKRDKETNSIYYRVTYQGLVEEEKRVKQNLIKDHKIHKPAEIFFPSDQASPLTKSDKTNKNKQKATDKSK